MDNHNDNRLTTSLALLGLFVTIGVDLPLSVALVALYLAGTRFPPT